jgi:hypothetical protein
MVEASPPRVSFSVTGYGKFRGVEQNPSAELISRLARRVDAGISKASQRAPPRRRLWRGAGRARASAQSGGPVGAKPRAVRRFPHLHSNRV